MLIDESLKNNLQAHLFQIVRERDPYFATGGYFYVREYIRSELQKWGIVETHQFLDNGRTHQNIILNLPGDDAERPPILIGAHYDTVPGSPGADDNGSGIVVLLELARIFATTPAKYPLRLVAFDLEEYGLLGSSAYAKHLHANKEPLRLMISLEMLGYRDSTPNSQRYPAGLQYFYPNTGDFIALIGNLSNLIDLKKISHSIKTTANIPCEILPVPLRGFVVPDTRRSDHAPFWDQGYAAIMITDTANMRNPHYHNPTDTLDTLDLDFLTGVCQGLAAAIYNL